MHIAEEISENRFKIAGGDEGDEGLLAGYGLSQDPWAAANPFEVEQEKREQERGRYLDPSLYDAPEEQRVILRPIAEAVEEEQRAPEPAGIDFVEKERRRRTIELLRPVEGPELEELRRRMGREETKLEELRRRIKREEAEEEEIT